MTEQAEVYDERARRGESLVVALPDPWRSARNDERAEATSRALDEAQKRHAEALRAIATRLILQLLPAARTVVFGKDEDVHGVTRIDLLAIRAGDGALLWYDPYTTFASFPEAAAFCESVAYGERRFITLDHDTQNAIESVLVAAYDTRPGFFDTADEPGPDGSPYDRNLLQVTIPEVAAYADGKPMPAIVVDQALMRKWLAGGNAEDLTDDPYWRPTPSTVAELIDYMRDSAINYYDIGWQMNPNIADVYASPSNTDTEDAVIVRADLAGGGRVCTLPITNRELRTKKRGVEAALESLVYVAAALSESFPADFPES